ncbi:TIGR00730 family Rossman fold protein [Helcococcus massiliensis]|uniref:LOG family protein n=1 Tax=Helcococcus massiliensis TaxID=2040290 RepID=UPI000CDE81FC|nr:TIGR00730 family Rossman fold protein [Helcococcus massiliensis]
MNILVYLGSKTGKDKIYTEAATEVADWIVENGHNLVYGGNAKGLMGVLAKRVKEKGGKVIGVMPEFLLEIEERYEECDEYILTQTMQERKDKVRDLSQVCLAIPGGPGTMEEITEAYSLYLVGQNPNPCILYNKNGYYDNLERMYDDMVREGFLDEEARKDFLFSDDFAEIETFIQERL